MVTFQLLPFLTAQNDDWYFSKGWASCYKPWTHQLREVDWEPVTPQSYTLAAKSRADGIPCDTLGLSTGKEPSGFGHLASWWPTPPVEGI